MSHGMRLRSAVMREAATVDTNHATVARHYRQRRREINLWCYMGREANANMDDAREKIKAEVQREYVQLAEAHFERAWELRDETCEPVPDGALAGSRSCMRVRVRAPCPGDACAVHECDAQHVPPGRAYPEIVTASITSMFMAY